jgi:hypothetical protein
METVKPREDDFRRPAGPIGQLGPVFHRINLSFRYMNTILGRFA